MNEFTLNMSGKATRLHEIALHACIYKANLSELDIVTMLINQYRYSLLKEEFIALHELGIEIELVENRPALLKNGEIDTLETVEAFDALFDEANAYVSLLISKNAQIVREHNERGELMTQTKAQRKALTAKLHKFIKIEEAYAHKCNEKIFYPQKKYQVNEGAQVCA